MKPRLIVHTAANDLALFRHVAEAASVLTDRYDVRIVVSTLTRKNQAELAGRRDSYLEYTANFPKLFHFAVPAALHPYHDRAYVEANRELMGRKVTLLHEMGLGAAFMGIEPSFAPEALFERFPGWRGPQVDQPVRSRDPVFALDLNHEDVERLYRQTVAELVRAYPELDTFFIWSNDAAAGLSWYENAYFGPNGPEATRGQGYAGATAAWHRAMLEGARDGGAGEPVSVLHGSDSQVDYRDMPPGAYRFPGDNSRVASDGVLCLGADVSMTYPIRYLWDPLRVLEKVAQVHEWRPPVITLYVSDVYNRTHTDLGSTRRLFRLWGMAERRPEQSARLPGQLTLLGELAAAEFGAAAADEIVDGWLDRHEAFKLQYPSFNNVSTRYLPVYGLVSHRWLTRPLVAFPEEVAEEEENYFLPHVWDWCGEEECRQQVLDFHGYAVANPAGAYNQHSALFSAIATPFNAAAEHFGRAAERSAGASRDELRLMATAARLMDRCWRTCQHTVEFGVLRAKAVEQSREEFVIPMRQHSVFGEGGDRHQRFQRHFYAVLRRELDNVAAMQELLGEDGEKVLWRAETPEEEDTFTLGPDIQSQLSRKRQLMLAHWHKIGRLRPAPGC